MSQVVVPLGVAGERFHYFDAMTVMRIDRSVFNPNPYTDHYGYYFFSTAGSRAKVTFEGNGHVDILLGRYAEAPEAPPYKWVEGTVVKIVDEVIPGTKSFEFNVLPGYMFEPRVLKNQPGIRGIVVERIGPIRWWDRLTTWQKIAFIAGAMTAIPIGLYVIPRLRRR